MTLLSPAGKCLVLARAGKNSAGNAARLNLFADVTVQYYRRRPEDLPVVTQVSLNGSLSRLPEPALYPFANVLAELADALTVDLNHGEPLYEYLASGLRGLVLHPDPEKVALVYAWAMLGLAGLAPETVACGSCGADGPLSTLDVADGFMLCAACSPAPLPPSPFGSELRVLASGRVRAGLGLDLEGREAHWRQLNRWLDRHVDRLRSSQAAWRPEAGALAGA